MIKTSFKGYHKINHDKNVFMVQNMLIYHLTTFNIHIFKVREITEGRTETKFHVWTLIAKS